MFFANISKKKWGFSVVLLALVAIVMLSGMQVARGEHRPLKRTP